MITGTVESREARIRLTIRGSNGREAEIEAVVDTGYTAALTLPQTTISKLALEWQSVDRGTLADGSECIFDVF